LFLSFLGAIALVALTVARDFDYWRLLLTLLVASFLIFDEESAGVILWLLLAIDRLLGHNRDRLPLSGTFDPAGVGSVAPSAIQPILELLHGRF